MGGKEDAIEELYNSVSYKEKIMSQTSNDLKSEISSKKRLIAILFWVFLGAVGGHRFYAGRILSATAILFLFVLGGCTAPIGIGGVFILIVGIWDAIDLISILIGKFKDGKGYPIINWK